MGVETASHHCFVYTEIFTVTLLEVSSSFGSSTVTATNEVKIMDSSYHSCKSTGASFFAVSEPNTLTLENCTFKDVSVGVSSEVGISYYVFQASVKTDLSMQFCDVDMQIGGGIDAHHEGALSLHSCDFRRATFRELRFEHGYMRRKPKIRLGQR